MPHGTHHAFTSLALERPRVAVTEGHTGLFLMRTRGLVVTLGATRGIVLIAARRERKNVYLAHAIKFPPAQ